MAKPKRRIEPKHGRPGLPYRKKWKRTFVEGNPDPEGFVIPANVDASKLRYEVAFLQFEKGRAFAACAQGLQSALFPSGGRFVSGVVLAKGLSRAEADLMVDRLSKSAEMPILPAPPEPDDKG